jgi:uncharacterized protein YjbI with pentapeptide repeats
MELPMPRARLPLDDILDPVARGLTGAARAPEPEAQSEPAPDVEAQLAHIAELSRNARATWFALIGLCLFVGVTLLGHKDADFFFGSEIELPLVGSVDLIRSFFACAPLLLAVLYLVLVLCLTKLRNALCDGQHRIDGREPGAPVFRSPMARASVRDSGGKPAGLSVARVTPVRFLAFPGYGASYLLVPFVVGLLWYRSLPAHYEWLTLWIAINLWTVIVLGLVGVRAWMGRRGSGSWISGISQCLGAVALALFVMGISWLRTEGGFEAYAAWIKDAGKRMGAPAAADWLADSLPETGDIEALTSWRWLRLYPADLRGERLTVLPDDWQPDDDWIRDLFAGYRESQGMAPFARLSPQQTSDFWGRALLTLFDRFANVRGPDLRLRDLRGALMTGTTLTRADLRGARLDDAILARSNLEGANLGCVTLRGGGTLCTSLVRAVLVEARMLGANLEGAQLQGAKLEAAKLQVASLIRARLMRANLSSAQMQGVLFNVPRGLESYGLNMGMPSPSADSVAAEARDPDAADLEEANLRHTRLNGAYLVNVRLRRADLRDASLLGARLHLAQMEGAILRRTQMQGAELGDARLQGADLHGSMLWGARLQGANLRGADLSKARLTEADLARADMRGANLRQAELGEANLSKTDLRGADLSHARLAGANLSEANLRGADLQKANLRVADLGRAQLEGADCAAAVFAGALLTGASVRCRADTLHQAQLEGAVGDRGTILPDRLFVLSCVVSLPKAAETTLWYYPDRPTGSLRFTRAELREALYCGVGEKPHATGSWPFERRYWDR